MQKVQAEISLGNIRANALAFKNHTKNKLCAVVKANAYGHGAEEVTNALNGIADCYAVALIEEGLALRIAAAGTDILVFTPPITEEEGIALAENSFIATVPNLFTAKLLSKICKERRLRLNVHIKVNTGMNRYGANVSMLGKICAFLKNDEYVRVTGLYSHLYGNRTSAVSQRTLFLQMVRIAKRYFPDICCHLSATSGCLYGKEFAFDMVRVGIGLYGYLPDGLIGQAKQQGKSLQLKKAMKVYAYSTGIRKIRFGGLGYGKSVSKSMLAKKLRISLLRFGYADGFLRKKHNGTNGNPKNVNNACMDVCMREGRIERGVKTPILLDARETAKQTGTIAYEVLCKATIRAEFIYKNK
jgi:alanine racemase